jgi:Carboxypeptidase regulatory-like domain/TonB dependent receptor
MKWVCFFAALAACAAALFGQAANGTITGTVTDPAGAVVPNAPVRVRNTGTGVTYQTVTTKTGDYTVTELPVGTYQVTIQAPGFKTYTHRNIQVQAAGVVREDPKLEIGASAETVTIAAQSTLLRTETGDFGVNIDTGSITNLPLLPIGTVNAGSSGIRNPFSMIELLPGLGEYIPNNTMIVNGLGGVLAPTEGFRIEGMDFTNHLVSYAVQENQPSADAIQEVAIQTSNFAPEFGQGGGTILNLTMKSGTNQVHGTVYENFVNEDLNAGVPFSIDTATGQKERPRNRRNDFGGALGGPVVIPKLYNGRNRTFFFWNFEDYLETQQYSFGLTVPTTDYLNGNFSHISPNGDCSFCALYGIQTTALGFPIPTTDALGRPMYANEIYDPLSRGVVAASNLGYANPFPNNMIPPSRISPVAAAIQALFPAPQAPSDVLTSNAAGPIPGHRGTTIPSLKLDQVITNKDKLSFYWSKTSTQSQISSPGGDADGLPLEIGMYRGTFIYYNLFRLNYDRSITPALLLHLGAGFAKHDFGDQAPFLNFDPSQFGLSGFEIHRQFPTISGMNAAGPSGAFTSYGGMQAIGTSGQTQTDDHQEKPAFNANVTWVRGTHTYKLGAEMYLENTYYGSFAGVTLPTGVNATSEPFTPLASLGSFGTGFGYASFLLGDFNSSPTCVASLIDNCITQTPQLNYRTGKQQWATYIQDSWKATRKLTMDYGLRWDLGTAPKETYGRLGEFDPNTPNQSAGGRLGSTLYASTCGCNFYPRAYPYAIGPRVGAAYQIDPKTVFRAGWGLVYQFTSFGLPAGIVSTTATNSVPGINSFVNIQSPGAIPQPGWPVTNPFVYPVAGTTSGAPADPDRNWARPPRINQWSAGFQREITRNFVIEAAYVANRAVWLPSSGPGSFISQISPAVYAQYGFYPYPNTGTTGYTPAQNYADFLLLSQPIGSTAVMQRMKAAGVANGGLLLPYSGFPISSPLESALLPYPQFGGSLAVTGFANGESRYDSLQMKATKRLSHNLQAGGTFTWSRAFELSGRQDFWNPQSSVWELQPADIPLLLNANFVYTTPSAPFLKRYENAIIKDWQIAGWVQYESGALLAPPGSATLNLLPSEEFRVPGVPLYLKNENCRCINPFYDQVLNPAAWTNVPIGAAGPAIGTYYSDFRGPRHPWENFNFGRNFRMGPEGKYNFQVRAEFVNIFNRTYLPNPSTLLNTTTPLTRIPPGYLVSGFGVIDAYQAPNTFSIFFPSSASTIPTPRTGMIVARFTF